MADNNSRQQLIEKITAFLERERELFGDFRVTTDTGTNSSPTGATGTRDGDGSTVKETSDPPGKPSDKPEESTTQAPGFVADPSLEPNSGGKRRRKKEGETMQEGFFNQDPSNKVYYKIKDCTSLEQLETLCKDADVLRTDLEGTNLVFGVGNPNADLLLIGEAPGEQEDIQGEPFVGAAGKLLNKILKAIDLNREDVYIANILKHRPPDNRDPKPEERKRSLPFLIKQIELIDPKLILCLGKVSAQTMLKSEQSLTKMRGTFHKFMNRYELMVTFHPAALLYHPKWKRPTWEDMQKLRRRYDELNGQP